MDTPDTQVTPPAQADTAAVADPKPADTPLNLGADTGAKPADAPAPKADAPADGKTPDAKTEGTKDGEKPAGAPEAYEAFAMPDGFALDEQLLGEFTPVLKELNLPQAAAQKVIDFAPKLVEKTVQQTTAAVLAEVGLADRATWETAVRNDKEIGGDKLAENIALANKAVAAFGSPELRVMFLKTGVGAHPELVKAFVRIGKQISEDAFVPGGKTTTVANPAAKMYANSNMNP